MPHTDPTWTVPDDRRLPVFEPLAERVLRTGPETVRRTLWDTADGVLEHEGVELAAEPDGTWTTTGPGSERAVHGDADDARTAVEVHLRGRDIAPVRILDTTVATRTLLGPDDRVRAEVRDVRVDEGDPTSGTLRSVRTWTITAAEHPGTVRRVERLLTEEAGERVPASPARTAPPVRSRTTAAPAAAFVAAALDTARERVVAADPGVRLDAPDAVHRFRKALRRTRSVLTAFRGALDPQRTDALDAALREIGIVAGGARDAEVLGAGVHRSVGRAPAGYVDGPTIDRLVGHFAELRAANGDDLRRTLLDASWFAALDELDALRRDAPPGPHADDPAADFVAARIRHERHRLARRVRHDPTDPEAVHAVRKAARRLRYAVEAAGDLADVGHRRLGALRRLQDTLGAALDAAHAADSYREVARLAARDGQDTFGYGALATVESAVARDRLGRYEALVADR